MRSVLAVASALLLCSCGSSSSTSGASTEGGTDGAITTDDSGSLDGPLGPDQTADGALSSDASPGSQDAPADAPIDATHDAPHDAPTPGDASGGSSCSSASGCRTYSSYCGACTCFALAASAPDPACDAGTVSCLIDPCNGHTATCNSAGSCALQ